MDNGTDGWMDGWMGQVMKKASRRPLLYVIVKELGMCEMMEGTQKRAKACTYFEETSMGARETYHVPMLHTGEGRSCWKAHIVDLLLYKTLLTTLVKLISY
jgi:hypothetical protein